MSKTVKNITDKEFVHWHCHSEYSSFDGLSKLDDLVMHARQAGHPALALTDHGNVGGYIKFLQKCGATKDKGGKSIDYAPIKPILGCLMRGQEIVAIDGVKAVENIVVGDYVLTHRGRFRKVLSVMSRRHIGKLYTLRFSGCSRTLTLTDEHPVLLRTISSNNDPADTDRSSIVKWVRADEIVAGRKGKQLGLSTYNSYVCLPKIIGTNTSIDLIKYLPDNLGCVDGFIEKVSKNSKYETLNKWDLPCSLPLTKDIAYFIGLFAAEGSFARKDNGDVNGECRFSLGIHERHLADRICDIASDSFGLNANVYERPDKGGIEVSVCCLPLSYMLEGMCGSGCSNKQVPKEILTAVEDLQSSFIDGVLDGDGKQEGQRTLKVTSKSLAWGIRQLLANRGCWATVAESKEDNRQTAYLVPYSPDRKYARTLEDNDYLYKPLSDITCEDSDVDVFNFEVEEDHSYVTDCALHNCEFYLCRNHLWKSKDEAEKNGGFQIDGRKGNRHLNLFAMNYKGYQNLCSLNERAWIDGHYYKDPRIDIEMLAEHSEGLMCGTACLSSVINANLLHDKYDEAAKALGIFRDIFKENLFLEVMYHGIPEEGQIIPDILKLSADMNVPVLATNDAHYIKKSQAQSQEVLMCMSTSNCLTNPKHIHFPYQEFYMKSAQEMAHIFKNVPQTLYNTTEMAKRIDSADIEENLFGGMRLPVYDLPEGFTDPYEYLVSLAKQGMVKLGWEKSPRHIEALKKELFDIRVARDNNNYDFATYFLIVWDYINYAREQGIVTGCGRGSGYASVLLRSLGITYGPDPLDYGLLWERFLGFDEKRFIMEKDFGFAVKKKVSAAAVADSKDDLDDDREVEDDFGGVDRY